MTREICNRFGMGTTGWVKSGAVLFDERSSPDGNLAAFYEYESLDSCHGHRLFFLKDIISYIFPSKHLLNRDRS